MGLFGWLWSSTDETHERRGDPPADDGTGLEIPSRSAGVVSVTQSEALSLGSVYRAVGIRATALRQLSIDVERAGQTIDRPLIIRRPNDETTLGAFLEQTVVSRSLNGNAYWRIRRDAAGTANSLEVLNPADVTIETTSAGRVAGYTYRSQSLKLNEVAHLPKLRVPGSPYGLGPIQAARSEIRGAIDTAAYGSSFLTASDTPSGIVAIKSHITDDEAASIKKRLKESAGGRREVAVLGADASYSPVLLNPADAQWLESRQFDTIAIARLFGVPASLMLVGIEGSSLTYANISQEWLSFIKWGLADDLAEIEDAFSAILPRGQRARFNVEAFLRLDTTSRYSMHASALAAGWLTANEVRAIEGLETIAGGDALKPASTAPEAAK